VTLTALTKRDRIFRSEIPSGVRRSCFLEVGADRGTSPTQLDRDVARHCGIGNKLAMKTEDRKGKTETAMLVGLDRGHAWTIASEGPDTASRARTNF
jgi:hypothetical protein